MAELAYTNVPLHVLKDAELGLFHFMAEVEGALIPIALQKIGHVEAMIASKDVLSVKAPDSTPPVEPAPAATPAD